MFTYGCQHTTRDGSERKWNQKLGSELKALRMKGDFGADLTNRTAETQCGMQQGEKQWRLPRKVSRSRPVSHYGHHESNLRMCEREEGHGIGELQSAICRREMGAACFGRTSGVLLNIAERQLTMTRKRAMPLEKCIMKGIFMIEVCSMVMSYNLGLELLPNA
jgi:hypothetical protein